MNFRPHVSDKRATRRLTVLNELGLHARPATEFVKCVRTFRSDITIVRDDGQKFHADRILEVLTADLPQGASFTVEAVGPDSEQAVERLEALMHELN